MNKKLASIVLVSLGSSVWGQSDDPLLSAWPTEGSNQFAAVYETNESEEPVTTWPSEGLLNTNTNGGQDTEVLADVQRIEYSDDWVYVHSSGLASHRMGPWYFDVGSIFGNWPTDQGTITKISRHPVEATEKEANQLGGLGIWSNGVAVFNMLDGFSYSNADGVDVQGGPDGGAGDGAPPEGEGPPDGMAPPDGMGPPDGGGGAPAGGDGIWVRNAMLAELVTFDSGNAHQPPSGTYHYHANPTALRVQMGDNLLYDESSDSYSEVTGDFVHSPILGYALDGFPIYGPYGYSDANDSSSEIRRIKSGYQLRDGSNGTVDVNTEGRISLAPWSADFHEHSAELIESEYGPDVSDEFPLGWYIEDHAHMSELGFVQGVDYDLDIYNGRFCVTPEYPEGTYAYFVTIDEDGEAAFPYVIGREYYGEVTGGNVQTVDEETSLYYERGANTRLTNISTRANVGTGDSIEIAGFVIDGAADKDVIIRGVGPALSGMVEGDVLSDPQLVLYDSDSEVVDSNDDWDGNGDSATIADVSASVGAFSLESGSGDAVIHTSLSPGLYTVHLYGADGGSGLAMAEVYDAELDEYSSMLTNISTRANVGAGEQVAVAGFVIEGEEAKTVLLRGVGPGLADQGVDGYISDPILMLYRGDELIYQNDNWSDNANVDELEASGLAVGAFDLGASSEDAALLVDLQPGLYTVHLANNDASEGIGLVELYEVQ